MILYKSKHVSVEEGRKHVLLQTLMITETIKSQCTSNFSLNAFAQECR